MSLIIYGIICIPKRGAALRLGIPLVCGAMTRGDPWKNNSKTATEIVLGLQIHLANLVFDKLLWEQAAGLMFYAQITTDEARTNSKGTCFLGVSPENWYFMCSKAVKCVI